MEAGEGKSRRAVSDVAHTWYCIYAFELQTAKPAGLYCFTSHLHLLFNTALDNLSQPHTQQLSPLKVSIRVRLAGMPWSHHYPLYFNLGNM